MQRKRRKQRFSGGIAANSAIISQATKRPGPTLQPQKNLCFLCYLCISRFCFLHLPKTAVLNLINMDIGSYFYVLRRPICKACFGNSVPVREAAEFQRPFPHGKAFRPEKNGT